MAATGADVVLATKLHVPRPRPGLVARPRLADLLDSALPGGLVLVCARPPPSTAAEPRLADPLTPRELEVLRLLAAGQTNQRIARDLVVTLDTVKKHVSHVLAKLGAVNRTEAVARGRELELIP